VRFRSHNASQRISSKINARFATVCTNVEKLSIKENRRRMHEFFH